MPESAPLQTMLDEVKPKKKTKSQPKEDDSAIKAPNYRELAIGSKKGLWKIHDWVYESEKIFKPDQVNSKMEPKPKQVCRVVVEQRSNGFRHFNLFVKFQKSESTVALYKLSDAVQKKLLTKMQLADGSNFTEKMLVLTYNRLPKTNLVFTKNHPICGFIGDAVAVKIIAKHKDNFTFEKLVQREPKRYDAKYTGCEKPLQMPLECTLKPSAEKSTKKRKVPITETTYEPPDTGLINPSANKASEHLAKLRAQMSVENADDLSKVVGSDIDIVVEVRLAALTRSRTTTSPSNGAKSSGRKRRKQPQPA